MPRTEPPRQCSAKRRRCFAFLCLAFARLFGATAVHRPAMPVPCSATPMPIVESSCRCRKTQFNAAARLCIALPSRGCGLLSSAFAVKRGALQCPCRELLPNAELRRGGALSCVALAHRCVAGRRQALPALRYDSLCLYCAPLSHRRAFPGYAVPSRGKANRRCATPMRL